jgi:hypothetical protein
MGAKDDFHRQVGARHYAGHQTGDELLKIDLIFFGMTNSRPHTNRRP